MEKALSGFEEVVTMEEEKGEWGFKAYKQMVKLHFKRGHYDAMMKAYQVAHHITVGSLMNHLHLYGKLVDRWTLLMLRQ